MSRARWATSSGCQYRPPVCVASLSEGHGSYRGENSLRRRLSFQNSGCRCRDRRRPAWAEQKNSKSRLAGRHSIRPERCRACSDREVLRSSVAQAGDVGLDKSYREQARNPDRANLTECFRQTTLTWKRTRQHVPACPQPANAAIVARRCGPPKAVPSAIRTVARIASVRRQNSAGS